VTHKSWDVEPTIAVIDVGICTVCALGTVNQGGSELPLMQQCVGTSLAINVAHQVYGGLLYSLKIISFESSEFIFELGRYVCKSSDPAPAGQVSRGSKLGHPNSMSYHALPCVSLQAGQIAELVIISKLNRRRNSPSFLLQSFNLH
jgi:hypothetical protein